MTELHHPERSGHAASDFDRSNRNHQEDTNRARQAAEALFAPKQQTKELAAPVNTATDQATRKPRILSAVPEKSVPVEPVSSSRKVMSPSKRAKIPVAHFARIRTWLEYGMNITQVAEVYGVTVGEIESIRHKA
jgi:hypothetical protein